jgi:hypothetical protein
VLVHLAAKERLFVFPQYNIQWDEDTKIGGTCPDFVAIHPDRPGLIYGVEVSAKYNLKRFE